MARDQGGDEEFRQLTPLPCEENSTIGLNSPTLPEMTRFGAARQMVWVIFGRLTCAHVKHAAETSVAISDANAMNVCESRRILADGSQRHLNSERTSADV